MQYIFAVLLIGLVLYFAARWFVNADPSKLVAVVRNFSKWGLIFLGAVLLLRGQFLIGVPMILAGIAGLIGFSPARGLFGQGPARRAQGTTSQVRSRMLAMQLDHDTGTIDGTVLKGMYEGRGLSDLGLEDLFRLHRECVAEGDRSAALLQAYLDRMHPDWRDELGESADASGTNGANGAKHEAGGALTREQAYEVLGLPVGAGDADIRKAHKALMKQFHPDKGGSDYLAAMINQAKDLLLGE